MVTLNQLETRVEDGSRAAGLSGNVQRELADLIRKAEQESGEASAGRAHWLYSMPLAGVRYFCYDEPSDTDRGAK
jgi:hypothetical protein